MIITESDILDPEVEEFSVYVHCEACDRDPLPALDMVRQFDGAWLCWDCDADVRAESREFALGWGR